MSVKRFFNSSFNEMCKHLTTYKLEKRLAPIILLLEQQTTFTLIARLRPTSNYKREERLVTYRVRFNLVLTPPYVFLNPPRPASKTLVLER